MSTMPSGSSMSQFQSAISQAVREHWKLFLVEGIILVILGILAIIIPPLATIGITIFIGWLFLISGIAGLITTYGARQAPGFWWSLLSAILGIAAGIVLLAWPVSGAVSLTLLLIVFFVIEGVLSIMYALEHKRELHGTMGLDAVQRHHRSHSCRHHLCRPARHRRLGARPPRRHQHAVRRLVHDRHRAAWT